MGRAGGLMNTIVIPASGTVNLLAWSEFDDRQVFDFNGCTGQVEWRRPVVGLVFRPALVREGDGYKYDPRGPVPFISDRDGDSLRVEPLVVADLGSVYRIHDYLYSLFGGDHWEHTAHFYEPHIAGPVTEAPRVKRLDRKRPSGRFCYADCPTCEQPV